MAQQIEANEDLASHDGYFPAPFSLDPMPDDLRLALVAPAVMGLLSAMSTLALITFIIYRLASWRKHYKTFIGYNQYVMLVLNLLIADFQQSAAFLISWYWISKRMIVAPTSACFGQGWLLHSGDVSSALFVLAIAVHTFSTAVMGYRISNTVFYSTVLMLWILAYLLTAIGVAMHPNDYFVRAGAWCWVSSEYESERLFLHYIWVFVVEFSTVAIYAVTFFALRYKTKQAFKNYRERLDVPNPKTVKAVNRVTRLMTLYPCIYILLTLPLSAGRMWSMAHQGRSTSDTFSCIAGALLASCGWADALLYTLTRRRLLQDTTPGRNHRVDHGIMTTKTITVHDHGHTAQDGQEAMDGFIDAQNRYVQIEAGRSTERWIEEQQPDDVKALKRLGIEIGDIRVHDFEPGRVQSPPVQMPGRMKRMPWD